MNNFEYCSIEVSKALGRELTGEEKKQLGEAVENLIKQFDNGDTVGNLTDAVLKGLKSLSEDIKVTALIEKRNAALNAKARIDIENYLLSIWGDNPPEGLRAYLGNSLADRQGSKNGVGTQVSALQAHYIEGMTSRLAKEGLIDHVSKGTLDREVWLAMTELQKPTPNENGLKQFPNEAIQIAKIFNEYNDLARGEANKAGAWIKELPGYVARRTHDPVKLRKMGFEGWLNFVRDKLDWDKTMPEVPEAKRNDVLKKIYGRLSEGYFVKFDDGGTTGLTGLASIGKKLSHERVLHFKTPEFEYAYHKQFAVGDTLGDSMMTGMSHMARDTAIMKKLGPNAKANLDAAVTSAIEKLDKTNSELAGSLTKQKKVIDRVYWPELTGENKIPGHETFAAVFQAIRLDEILHTMGRVIASATTDFHYYGGTNRHYTSRTLSAYFEGILEALGNIVGGKDLKAPEMRGLLSELGVMNDMIKSAPYDGFSDMSVPGRMSRMAQTFFKWGGWSRWQEKMRTGAAAGFAHRYSNYVGHTFENLEPGVKAALRQYDITPADWEIIRKGELFTDSKGRNYLTPESVKYAPNEAFDSLPSVKGKSGKSLDRAREAAREKIVTNLRTMFSDIASMASSEGGFMEKAMMVQGTQPGTPEGEFMRTVGLLKGFVATATRRHMGRELHGYSADRLSTPKALWRAMKGEGDGAFTGMVTAMAGGAFFGYVSLASHDLLKGRMPRIPKTQEDLAKLLGASLIAGGTMGIYGDFLFGDMRNRYGHTAVETLAGPVAGSFSDLMDIWGRIREGDDAAAKAFNFLLNHTPGVNAAYNVFYNKLALDYLLFFQLQEQMNPGYLKRMERRLEREQNQTYMLPPSQYRFFK
jgi:hypothetical protein